MKSFLVNKRVLVFGGFHFSDICITKHISFPSVIYIQRDGKSIFFEKEILLSILEALFPPPYSCFMHVRIQNSNGRRFYRRLMGARDMTPLWESKTTLDIKLLDVLPSGFWLMPVTLCFLNLKTIYWCLIFFFASSYCVILYRISWVWCLVVLNCRSFF